MIERYSAEVVVVHLEPDAIADMERHCNASPGMETGGILFGYYERDLRNAHILQATAPPNDSKRGYAWFHRGVRGLQSMTDVLWRSSTRRYYLGEWHFHPGSSPEPSGTDRSELRDIAADPHLSCPEPILVINGQRHGKFTRSVSLVYRGDFLRLAPE